MIKVGGLFGGGSVNPEDIDNLVPENIRKDVNILGIIGTMTEGVNFLEYGPYSKVEVVTFTPSTNTTLKTGLTINHNLDIIPRFIIVVSPDASETTNNAIKELLGVFHVGKSNTSGAGCVKYYSSGNGLLFSSYISSFTAGVASAAAVNLKYSLGDQFFQAGATYNAIIVG